MQSNIGHTLSKLNLFFKLKNLKKQSFLLKKLAMEIAQENIREEVAEAKEDRQSIGAFDYSSLFEDGKEYVVLSPKDYFPKYVENKKAILNMINDKKILFDSLNGSPISIDLMKENPYQLSVSNKKVDLAKWGLKPSWSTTGMFEEEALKSLFKSIYLNRAIGDLRRFFGQDGYAIKDYLVTDPILKIDSLSDVNNLSDFKKIFNVSPILFYDGNIEDVISEIEELLSEKGIDRKVNKEELSFIIKNSEKTLENLIPIMDDLDGFFYKLRAYSSGKDKVSKYSVVISYDPNDIATATYCKPQGPFDTDDSDWDEKTKGTGWWSCKNIYEDRDILDDVRYGGLVAYLVNSERPYPINNPRARVRIRHFKNALSGKSNDFILKKEPKTYGEDINSNGKGVLNTVVDKWVERSNSLIDSSGLLYTLSGDQSTDGLDSIDIMTKGRFDFGEEKIDAAKASSIYRELKSSMEEINNEIEESVAIDLFIVSSFFGENISTEDIAYAYNDNSYGKISNYDISGNERIGAKDSAIIFSNISSTEIGGSVIKKSENFIDITKEEMIGLIESFSHYFKILASNMFESSESEYLIGSALNIVLEALSTDDTLIYNLKKIVPKNRSISWGSSRYRGEELDFKDACEEIIINWYLKYFSSEFNRIIRLDPPSYYSDEKEIRDSFMDHISEFCSSLLNYTDNYDKSLYLKLVNEVLTGTDAEDLYPKPWMSSNKSFKRKSWINTFSEKFSPIANSILRESLGDVLDEEDLDDMDGATNILYEKLTSEDDLDIDDEFKESLKDWLLRYSSAAMVDRGLLNVETEDEAVEKIREIARISGHNIKSVEESYFIIKTENIYSQMHPYFSYGGTYYYKRKASHGGSSIYNLYRVRRQDLFTEDQERQYASLTGIDPNKVRPFKDFFSGRTQYRAV